MTLNNKTVLMVAGWLLAALASFLLIAQQLKWNRQEVLWQAQLNAQHERVVELELIIAELHTDIDESGPTINETATKTGSAITNIFEKVKNTLKREAHPGE